MITAVFTLLFCAYLFCGLYVLFLNTRNRLNRIFFIITLFFALICLTSIILSQVILSEESEQIIFKAATILYIINIYLILIFNASLIRISKTTWYIVFFLSLPVIYVAINILFSLDILFDHENGIEYFSYNLANKNNQRIMNYVSAINLVNIFSSVSILISAYRKSITRKLKKQVTIILITLTVCYMITFIDYGIMMVVSKSPNPKRIAGIVVLYNLIWIFGIGYALVKYRFLTLDIATINRHIIYHIDEMVILVSPDFHVLLVNQKLKEITQLKNNLYGKHISSLVHESELIMNELAEHPGGDETTISCHLHFKDKENKKIRANAKIKKIRDKFQDIIGYLIIAKELRGVRQLQEIYKITDREANIIQAVIAGRTNHEIADELGITERTVKSHMTHTFNKLNVTSRVQLLIKLKDFHLIPEGEADKILFSKEEPPEDFQPSAQP